MPEIQTIQILVIFYLYLLARWQFVRRPLFFLLGALGLVFAMVGHFFIISGDAGQGLRIVNNVFNLIGCLVAFISAVGACFGGKLPGVEASMHDTMQQIQK